MRRLPIALVALVLWAVALGAGAGAENPETPQYGGTLSLVTVYRALSALSWDTADWNWKQNHDTGMIYEQLFAADLQKSLRKGGPHPFTMEAWLPADAIRGELAESWEWEDELTLAIRLRRGVRFTGKPGVMPGREIDAHDVVFTFERQDNSPKKISAYFDHIQSVSARDERTVVFEFSEYNAEWDYRFGYGYYSGIVPREIAEVDAKDWRNMVGTGPFVLTDFIPGNKQTYVRNPDYWDREVIAGAAHRIPFIDRLVYRTMADEATVMTALRTGKIDIAETLRWIVVDHLKETTPELHWNRFLSTSGSFIALRNDREPFEDVRVRRALNYAVDHREIVDLFYGGHAEILGYPMHPAFVGYYEPLESMPDSVRDLFAYDPAKARRLLAEAGYADGFSFTAQVCVCDANLMELVPLVASYLAEVGVRLEIQPLQYAAHLSLMTSRNHAAGYAVASGVVNPTTALRKNFQSGQLWNIAIFEDAEIDRRIAKAIATRDVEARKEMVREVARDVLAEAPYLWLPSPYYYTAWWPWVKNYNGELRAGAVRPGPIYSRLWIDKRMKRELGFE